MGRARIISEAGAGFYTVEVLNDVTTAEEEIAKLDRIIQSAEIQLTEETAKPPEEQNKVRIRAIETRIISLEERRAVIVSAIDPAGQVVEAWCADLTEGLSGDVGTIELAAEYKNGVNIRPGGELLGESHDGIRTPFLTMNVADAMRNFAIMPGIQKFCPTFRYGIISDIDFDANTCRVTLEPTFSGIQSLDVNLVNALSDVPIDYMTCHAAAFTDGDSVVVEFEGHSWDSPKVIGFKSNPKGCGIFLKLQSINGVAFPGGANSYKLRVTQPIPTAVDHWRKGTYTEDFVVIGEGEVDAAGVAEIQPEPGVSINPDYPINIGIKNPSKWKYYTTDWRGSLPDAGYQWQPYYTNYTGWTFNPADWETGGYDFLVDLVEYHEEEGVDLRTEAKAIFQNANGDTVSGYVVDFSGIKLLQRDHTKYWYTTLEGQDNSEETELDAVQFVPRTFDNQDRFYSYSLTFPWNYELFDAVSTFSCYGGDSGEAYKAYFNAGYYDPPAIWELTKNDPFIMCDRRGKDISYQQSEAVLEAEGNFTCQWTWKETLDGYRCLNWKTGATAWTVGMCSPGESVAGSNPCDPDTNFCEAGAIDAGEYMKYQAIDLSADNI